MRENAFYTNYVKMEVALFFEPFLLIFVLSKIPFLSVLFFYNIFTVKFSEMDLNIFYY